MYFVVVGLMILAAATAWWGLWLVGKGRLSPAYRLSAPLVIVAAAVCGVLTVLRIREAFEAVAWADASVKQSLLSEKIASAGDPLVVGFVIVGAVALALGVASALGGKTGAPDAT